MAKKIIKAQMKQRLDTKANWAAQNPVLLAGELGIVSDDPNLYKVGDGTTAWNGLPFRGFDGTLVHTTGDSETAAMSQKGVTEELAKLSEDFANRLLLISGKADIKIPKMASNGWQYFAMPGFKKDGNYAMELSFEEAFGSDIYWYVRSGDETLVATQVLTANNVGKAQFSAKQDYEKVELGIYSAPTIPSMLLKFFADSSELSMFGEYKSNEEYIRIYTDADNKFIWGIKADGSIEWAKGIPTPIKKQMESLSETVDNLSAPTAEDNVDGYLEMTIDADGGVVSYRDSSGNWIENVGIKTRRLTLSKEGMSEFEKALKEDGFTTGASDLSDASFIQIPLPTSLVRVNITASHFPTSKTDEIDGTIEFIDHNGNYFKKPIEALALQGSTSLGAPKKNLKFDFVDTEVKIGDWVVQDSFHLKSNYYDIFRGKSNLAYDYWLDILKCKRADLFRKPYLNPSEYTAFNGKKNSDDFDNSARLTPAGFPIELYFNGEYYGIYTWNIKKDKANYAMSRDNVDNIHIDPDSIYYLLEGMRVDWGLFEIRNPKPKAKDGWEMTTMDGSKYDGDNPMELIDPTSASYSGSNLSHINSYEVKKRILAFKDACADFIAKKDKATFEKYFDAEWFVDFFIWSNVVLDGDGQDRNTQYLYWGGKWYPTPYDCDQIFGNNWRGNFIYRKSQRVVNRDIVAKGMYSAFYNLYKSRIAERFAELVDSGILTTEYICAKINGYMAIVGKDAYEKDLEKWSETPSYREPNDAMQWQFMGDYYEGTPQEWNDATSFTSGQYASMVVEGVTYYWLCKTSNKGVRPYIDKYGANPLVGGMFDSLTRTEMWLRERFAFLSNNWK